MEFILQAGIGAFVLIVALRAYFTITYAPYIKKMAEVFTAKNGIPTISTSALAARNPGIFGLNGGFEPLHRAAEINDISTLEMLIQNRTYYYEGALEETARRTSKLFCNFIPALYRVSEYWVSGTPLHFACHTNSEQAVEWLLDHGAFPDSVDDHGYTPLHHAVANENVKIIEMLLRQGAKPHLRPSNSTVFAHIKGRWGELTPYFLAKNDHIRALLSRDKRNEEVLKKCQAILDKELIPMTRKKENETRIKLSRLAVSREIQKNRANLQTPTTNSEGRGKVYDGYYNQLKEKDHKIHGRPYDPNHKKHRQWFSELERFGYEFGDSISGNNFDQSEKASKGDDYLNDNYVGNVDHLEEEEEDMTGEEFEEELPEVGIELQANLDENGGSEAVWDSQEGIIQRQENYIGEIQIDFEGKRNSLDLMRNIDNVIDRGSSHVLDLVTPLSPVPSPIQSLKKSRMVGRNENYSQQNDMQDELYFSQDEAFFQGNEDDIYTLTISPDIGNEPDPSTLDRFTRYKERMTQLRDPAEPKSTLEALNIPFDPMTQTDEDPTTIEGIVNWNERFQSSIQQLKIINQHINSTDQERTKVFSELVHLERDFLYCSETYGKIIISEYYLSLEQKTIKPINELGYAGGDKYIVHNILFKLAIDSRGLFGSSDWAAAKIGGHELKGLTNYWNCNLDISLPLMALVDYRGFRIIAMSILPITEDTLVSGSCDAGATVHASCTEMNSQLEKAASMLNLEGHTCGTTPGQTRNLYTATDLEGHIGLDGRLYIIDFSRSFPPEAPNSKYQRSYLYHLLRPEFVKKYPLPLCPDAFSNFIVHDPNANTHNIEIFKATLFLFKSVIPSFASKFETRVIDVIKSCQLKKFSVASELHSSGINCRMMGLVRSVLNPNQTNARYLLLVEMCARVIKNDIRFRLRQTSKLFKIPLEEPYRKKQTDYLNLVFGNGPDSVKYWNTTIKDQLMNQFSKGLDRYEYVNEDLKEKLCEFVVPTSKSQEEQYDAVLKYCDGRFLVLARVLSMLGIQIRPQLSYFLRWLNGHKMIKEMALVFQPEDISNIGQRVKHINIIDYAQGFIYKERGHYYERTESEDAKKFFQKAAEKFSSALDKHPNDQEVLTNYADLLTRIHGYGTAQYNKNPAGKDEHWVKTVYSYFERAVSLDDRDPRTLFQYATFLRYWRHDVDVAEEYFLTALEINPNFVRCLREYGNLINYRGNIEVAQQFYDRAKNILQMLQAEKEKEKEENSSWEAERLKLLLQYNNYLLAYRAKQKQKNNQNQTQMRGSTRKVRMLANPNMPNSPTNNNNYVASPTHSATNAASSTSSSTTTTPSRRRMKKRESIEPK